MKYESLLKPIKIGSLTIKNRFVMPAMHSSSAGSDHKFTELSKFYYGQRAKGEFGLIIPEFLAVDKTGYASGNEPSIESDEYLDSLKMVVDAIHEGGGLCAAQLHHAGVETDTSCVGMKPWSVSGLPSLKYKQEAHEMTVDEIEYLKGKYIEAADRAKRVGFDMVEVHCAHGYLGEQFLSVAYNRRSDEYGGSYENRARFVTDIIKGIKEKCGSDYPVQVRISAEEYIPNCMHINDVVVYAKLFEEAGADSISVSAGTPAGGMIVPTHYNRPGFNVENAYKVKQAVNIPVITVGRINDPDLALEIIESGKADLIALGRQSVCDYEFPKKVREGKTEEIYHCTGCMQRCYYGKPLDENDKGMSCMINPFSGKPHWNIEEATVKKVVAVIGGGVAGLEAAWILAKKGHHVDLFEKSSKLGGQYNYACVASEKQDFGKTVDTLYHIGLNAGVNFHLNTEVSIDDLNNKYDAVVVSTGAIPIIPRISGIECGVKANDIFAGKTVVGDKKVLILGGGIVGCECAEFLNEYNNSCTIVDMIKEFAPGLNKHVKKDMFTQFKEKGTQLIPETKVAEILKDGIVTADGNVLNGYDVVVVAFGSKPYLSINTEELTNKVYVVGDANKVRDAKHAIFEAAKTALEI